MSCVSFALFFGVSAGLGVSLDLSLGLHKANSG